MSDIGFQGLGALLIFLGLLVINSIFLILSILFLVIEKRKKKRVIKLLNSKGLFVSTMIVEVILLFLILFTEKTNDSDILGYLDLVSPIIAFIVLVGLIIINVRYSRQNKVSS